ncbi:MAG: histidine triad nucleotide-binding protein [Acidobacteriaceae bacterium]
MATDCIFCRIVSGAIPAKRLYEDDEVLAFPDAHPQAPTHVLLVPKQHIGSLGYTQVSHAALLGHLLAQAAEMARSAGLDGGYRVVVNTGRDGGQTVDHLHVHLLGGRAMGWPPG